MRPLLLRLPLVLGLLGSFLGGCKPKNQEELRLASDARYQHWVGKPSPPLKFKALDGREVDLEGLRGKVVLLDFWATWCPPCMEELPQVRDAYERFHKQGFEVIGVSFDMERRQLEEVVKHERIAWPQYFDGQGQSAAPGKTFGILHWPTMWLVDRNGVIRYISAGQRLDKKIATLLREEANPLLAAKAVADAKAALDKGGDAAAKPASPPPAGGPISPPGAPQDAAYLHWLGKPLPPVQFTAIDGRKVDTARLRGSVVLLDFWATWCAPCLAEIPNMKAVYDRYHRQGFEIVGVSADLDRADFERVVREKALPWPQCFDAANGSASIINRYGIAHYPSMWLVDQRGIIRDVTGMIALEGKVLRLLQEGGAAAPLTAATASAKPAPTSAPAPPSAPASRVPETKLGDHAISVKNISISSKRSTALLQIGPSTYTVSPGTELVFPSGGVQRKARCEAVERSAVVLSIEGTAEPLRLVLP